MWANDVIEDILQEREAPNQIFPYMLKKKESDLLSGVGGKDSQLVFILRFVPLNALCVLQLDEYN